LHNKTSGLPTLAKVKNRLVVVLKKKEEKKKIRICISIPAQPAEFYAQMF